MLVSQETRLTRPPVLLISIDTLDMTKRRADHSDGSDGGSDHLQGKW